MVVAVGQLAPPRRPSSRRTAPECVVAIVGLKASYAFYAYGPQQPVGRLLTAALMVGGAMNYKSEEKLLLLAFHAREFGMC